jgi:NhaP-type Na+/H+ or K+/H+ antiporter
MYLDLVIPACVLSGFVSIVTFFLYVRYRMHPRGEEEGTDQENARLERQEGKYQQIHFISLALFVLFGVLILIELSHRYNQPRITY